MNKQLKKILSTTATASGKKYQVHLSFIGEGYRGDFDANDPEDEPLLRIDIYNRDELDKRRWSNDCIYSTCTTASARVTADKARTLCRKIVVKLDKIPQAKYDKEGDDCIMSAWQSVLR